MRTRQGRTRTARAAECTCATTLRPGRRNVAAPQCACTCATEQHVRCWAPSPLVLVYLTRATASAWASHVALACSDRALRLDVVGCAIPCAARHAWPDGGTRSPRPMERRRVAHSGFAHGARAGARAYQSTSLCTSSRVGPGSLVGRRCGPTRKALPRLCAPSTAARHTAGVASLRDLSNGTVSRIGKMHTKTVRSYTYTK